jgi:hypothetical protein
VRADLYAGEHNGSGSQRDPVRKMNGPGDVHARMQRDKRPEHAVVPDRTIEVEKGVRPDLELNS